MLELEIALHRPVHDLESSSPVARRFGTLETLEAAFTLFSGIAPFFGTWADGPGAATRSLRRPPPTDVELRSIVIRAFSASTACPFASAASLR